MLAAISCKISPKDQRAVASHPSATTDQCRNLPTYRSSKNMQWYGLNPSRADFVFAAAHERQTYILVGGEVTIIPM